MYAEGLLDIDFISQGSSIWAAKVNEGNTGMFSYWRLQNTALNPNVAGDYEIMLPVHAEGKKACLPRNMDIIEFGAALTTDNRDIEASLRWLDAQFETENMLVSQNGAVGDTLSRREDGRYEVNYVPPDNELYKSVPVICGQFFAPADYYASVYVPAAHRQEKAAYCEQYEKAGVLEPVSAKIMTTAAPKTSEESAETARLKAKLKALVDAEIVAMVTEGVTEEGRAPPAELEEAGSGEYVQVYQQIYDRWRGEQTRDQERAGLSVFIRYALSYIAVVLLLFFSITGYLYIRLSGKVREEIINSQINRLSRIASQHESYISAMLNTAEEIGLSPQIEPFRYDEEPWKAYDLQLQLVPYTSTNPFCDQVYLHFPGMTGCIPPPPWSCPCLPG